MTAKAGRPDLNRAGNHSESSDTTPHQQSDSFLPWAHPLLLPVLRAIAESRISWSFLPPSSSSPPAAAASPSPAPTPPIIPRDQGIWLGERAKVVYESSEDEFSSDFASSEDDESDSEEDEEDGEADGDDAAEEGEGGKAAKAVSGMFGALEIEGGESEEESESEEETDEETGDDA